MFKTESVSVEANSFKQSHWHTYAVFAWYIPLALLINNGLIVLGLDQLPIQMGIVYFVLLIILTHYIISYLNALLPTYKNIYSLRLVGLKVLQSCFIVLILALLSGVWYIVFEYTFWWFRLRERGEFFELNLIQLLNDFLPKVVKQIVICEYIRQILPLLKVLKKEIIIYFSTWD